MPFTLQFEWGLGCEEEPCLVVTGYVCLTGNRGLLFEVGGAAKGVELTEATPGYRWQIVPNASSPSGFWSKEGRPFRYVVDWEPIARVY